MAQSTTINSGSVVVTMKFPLYRGGATIPVSGILLEGEAITTSPLVDQSARVATVNGGSIVNINSNGAGTGTMTVVYDDSFNNAWKIASEIAYSKNGENLQGGIITVTMEYNGQPRTIQYIDCVWQNVPIFSLNPMSPSSVSLSFNFADHTTIGAEVTA